MMEAGWRPSGCTLWCPWCRCQALRSHFPVAGDGAIGASGLTLWQRTEFIPNMVMSVMSVVSRKWVYPKIANLNGENVDTLMELGVHQFQPNSHDRGARLAQ